MKPSSPSTILSPSGVAAVCPSFAPTVSAPVPPKMMLRPVPVLIESSPPMPRASVYNRPMVSGCELKLGALAVAARIFALSPKTILAPTLASIVSPAAPPMMMSAPAPVVMVSAPPIPKSVEAQARIVESVESLQEETQRLESLYQRKLAALDALKKSLLHQAFSGQL